MKRSESLAWFAFVGLLALGILLLIGGIFYNNTALWAGMMLSFAQAVIVGLAAWGLSLARQRAELTELPPVPDSGFRMSFGNETAGPVAEIMAPQEIKTLDTGFQRLLVGLTAVALLILAAIISYWVYATFGWARLHPDKPFPIAGTFNKPVVFDVRALILGLAAASFYCVLYWVTRPTPKDDPAAAEAVNSNFTLGLPGMIALGLAAVLCDWQVAYATELAASIIAFLMALQGFELLVNCFRSFTAIEELDQNAVDLHALPLVPMLSSLWLSGLKLLFAQSVGISRTKEKTVMARMMPRAIIAIIIIGIFVSCLRVVQPGRVAILERLGAAQMQPDGKHYVLLQPGLHLTFPWPIDNLVAIPTEELQLADVGKELHGEKSLGKVLDFQFWTFRPDMKAGDEDTSSQFATGDPDYPQLLETYVVVLWRVNDPGKFYNSLSHSAFFEKQNGETAGQAAGETTEIPSYEALVNQCASFAVTFAFSTHSLDQIMTGERKEVEAHCRKILQEKLDEAGPDGKGCGIQVVDLTIKDLHPPLGFGEKPNPEHPDQPLLGPAAAYEDVVNAEQQMETRISRGKENKTIAINQATGAAAQEVDGAKADSFAKVAQAKGEATRLTHMFGAVETLPADQRGFMESLAKLQAMYTALKNVLNPINKIIIDPKVPGVDLYQSGNDSRTPMPPRPPG